MEVFTSLYSTECFSSSTKKIIPPDTTAINNMIKITIPTFFILTPFF